MIETPIWEPTSPSGSGDRRFAFSPKIGRQVAFSSTLESDYRLLLEFDPEVLRFCEQPATAVVLLDNRWQRSRLDFWVLRRQSGETFVEVKYVSDLRDPNSRAHQQIRIQRIALRAAGKQHQVVTDADIWANPILINSLRTLFAEFDFRYLELVESAKSHFLSIATFVANNSDSKIDQVIGQRPPSVAVEVYRLAVFEMIRTHVLDAGVETVELSPNSILRLGKGQKL